MGQALLHGAPDCGGLRDLAPSTQSPGFRIRRSYQRSNLHTGLASSKLRTQRFLAVAVVGIHTGTAVAVRSSSPVRSRQRTIAAIRSSGGRSHRRAHEHQWALGKFGGLHPLVFVVPGGACQAG